MKFKEIREGRSYQGRSGAVRKVVAMRPTIVFNVADRSIEVRENSFSMFEFLGLLEVAKAMAVDSWLRKTD